MSVFKYACRECGESYDTYWVARDCCSKGVRHVDAVGPIPSAQGSLTSATVVQTAAAPVSAADGRIEALLAQRTGRYGEFKHHAQVTQDLSRIIHKRLEQRGVILADDQAEAIHMVCHKLGRIANGDPDYDDSWDDIAGYAKLVADRLRADAATSGEQGDVTRQDEVHDALGIEA